MKTAFTDIGFTVIFLCCCQAPFCQPNKAEGLVKKAEGCMQKNDYANTVAYCKQALDASPQNYDALRLLGIAYDKLQSFSLAQNCFTNAINGYPDSAELYFERAKVLGETAQNSLALNDLNKALALSPHNGAYYSARAENLSALQDYAAAINDYKKAIDINTGDINACVGLGHNFYMEDNYDEALGYYKKALVIDTGYPAAYYGAGLASFRKGRYADAVGYLKKCIKIDSANGNALITLISVLICQKKFPEASGYYKTYVAYKPASAIEKDEGKFYLTFITTAVKLAAKFDYNEALNGLGQAEQQYNTYTIKAKYNSFLKSRYADVLAFKGYLLEKLGRAYEAKNIYQQALSLNQEQSEVKDALKKLNNPDLAADKTAPVITIISPTGTKEAAKDSGMRSIIVVDEKNQSGSGSGSHGGDGQQVEIVGRAKDENGLSAVKVNGLPASTVEEDGLFIAFVNLKNGSTSITVEATDKSNNTAKKTFTLPASVVAAHGPSAKPDDLPGAYGAQTFYAIIIGEQDYKDLSIPKLTHPVADAREFLSILKGSYTFNPANIDTLYNRSREDIVDAIYNRCNTMRENDNLLIFYAGHGTVSPSGSTTGYLIPVSAKLHSVASYIPMSAITDALKNSAAKHVLFIADACYSGSLLRDLPSDTPPDIQVSYKRKSRTAMTSGNLEPVPDNSQFLYFLKQRLKENNKKYLTAKALFDDLKTSVITNSDIHPQYGPVLNVGDEGGDFVFIKK